MDIFEFELRYLAYKWLWEKLKVEISEQEVLELVKRTNLWTLTKKLTELTPEELKALTLETYTDYKKQFVEKSKNIQVWRFTLFDYVSRLEYELKVIKEMGYNTYFLIVWDYINWSKTHDIAVGPWRWSAAWSILSYFVGIIDLDPLEYDLLFERFLNPARISMPDIDTDFEDTKRELVVEYVKNKYWESKVASIWTYMTMAAKAAFKDVARVFWLPFDQSNKISNLITGKNIKASLEENEEFKSLVESDTQIQEIVNLAIKLEWTVRQTWVHACWIIISPEDLVTYSPIQYPPKSWAKWQREESKYVTQYDWHYLEDIWLLKMDFLWLRNLSIIKNTIKIIIAKHKKENKEVPEMFSNYLHKMWFYPPLDDKFTYERIFQKWDTSWVFQFESDWMKAWLKALKPTDINDIIAMVALYRPWPMEFIPHYIKRKSWEDKIEYLLPELEELLTQKYGAEMIEWERQRLIEDLGPFMDVTYWIAVYQEQLMRLVQSMAWFSLAEADMLRRWVWKKIKEVVEKIKIDFIAKAETFHWYKPETSDFIYEKMIMPAADYSFNKSHAACYAIIAYQTAYLKAHFPIEFAAALLRSVEDETDKLAKFIDELKMWWYKVLPTDINYSYNHVAAVEDTVRIWFLAVKWVWYEIWKTIEEEREKNWKFKSFEDYLKRCSSIVNKKSLESLAKAWAFDEFIDRKTVLENIDTIQDFVKSQSSWWGWWLFDMWSFSSTLSFKKTYTTTLMEKVLFEYEIFKTFISAHPFDGMYNYIKWKYNFISMFKDVEWYWEFRIFCFVKAIEKFQRKWYFVTVEDLSWEVDIFLKDTLDIKEFDVLVLKWFKTKSIRVKQATKVNIVELIEKVKWLWKYNSEDTVIEVRAKRIAATEKKPVQVSEAIIPTKTIIQPKQDNDNWEDDNENIWDITQENISEEIEINTETIIEEDNYEETSENIEEQNETENSENETIDYKQNEVNTEINTWNNKWPIEIILPEDINKIKAIANIVKTDNWDIKIIIRGKEFWVSQNWYNEIQKLLK